MRDTLVLDANALISLFDGNDADLERALMGATELVLPVAAYAEVLAGTERACKRASRTLQALSGLLSMPDTRIHAATETTARHYSKIYNHLKKCGSPIPTNDLWIAATALEVDGVLFTRDRHFASIPMLRTMPDL